MQVRVHLHHALEMRPWTTTLNRVIVENSGKGLTADSLRHLLVRAQQYRALLLRTHSNIPFACCPCCTFAFLSFAFLSFPFFSPSTLWFIQHYKYVVCTVFVKVHSCMISFFLVVTDEDTVKRYYAKFEEKFFQTCEKELAKINTFYSGNKCKYNHCLAHIPSPIFSNH